MMNEADRVERFPLNGPCPNCDSEDVLRVQSGERMVVMGTGHVYLTRLICLTCGLSRECVDDFAELTRLRDAFSRRSYEHSSRHYDEETGIWVGDE